MYYFFSPTAGAAIAIVIIACLIVSGIRSSGKKLSSKAVEETMTFGEMRKELGPMTWKEHIVGLILIAMFIAIVASIASKL